MVRSKLTRRTAPGQSPILMKAPGLTRTVTRLPPMLQTLDLQPQYRSDRHDLLQNFYIPCLSRAVTYDRAVGYFSSQVLTRAAQGLSAFVDQRGKMRLVASPDLSPQDVAAIERGLQAREAVVEVAILRELKLAFETVAQDHLACLAWLLEQGILEIKLVVHQDLRQHGIYHEKLGIFRDASGNVVAFSGSANESQSGLQQNFECIDVFRSWEPRDRHRVAQKAENFTELWANRTPQLEVLEFPEAARRSLLKLKLPTPPTFAPPEQPLAQPQVRESQSAPYAVPDQAKAQSPPSKSAPSSAEPSNSIQSPSHKPNSSDTPALDSSISREGIPRLPNGLTLRDYQQAAITNWLNNKGRGTFKMATGSGKTIISLAATAQLYEKCQGQGHPLRALIILCPYRHLVTQWDQEARKFGLAPILAFESSKLWQAELQQQLIALNGQRQPFLTLITTNATLIRDSLQSQIPFFPPMTLLIGDEAHNLGAPHIEAKLPLQAPLRLALSATPERHLDDLGTEAIFRYFGPVLQPEFTLADAIQAGALVPYRYHPILVELTEEEAERYAKLSSRIGQLLAMGEEGEGGEFLSSLLIQRGRLLSSAVNKLEALRSLMTEPLPSGGSRLNNAHSLFYCGDGTIAPAALQQLFPDAPLPTEPRRQLDIVLEMLEQLGYRARAYTAETSLGDRNNLHYTFAKGLIQGLVAMRCLDEGVDIPAIETAVILASSSNPRQFIQRRGRILRKSPGKTQAELFDMIVMPPVLGRKTRGVERNLLRKELMRFVEFADLALNAGEARSKLYGLQQQYGLLDL